MRNEFGKKGVLGLGSKVIQVIGTVSLSFFISSMAHAQGSPRENFERLIQSFSKIATHCVVQPYAIQPSGHKIHGFLQSLCSEVRVTRSQFKNEAQFDLGQETYRVVVTDSMESDGGDLSDLSLYDSNGKLIATASALLVFSDPLRAILGSQAEGLKEVFDPSLLGNSRGF